MAIGDERHAISLYSTILESMLPDDKNYTVIVQVMSDEQDHQKKLLRMLGEKTPEPVEAT
jgi:rubrerythrin